MKPTDAYLTHDDWAEATRRFDAERKALFLELLGREPVLGEAIATRSNELDKTINAQNLTPEVKGLMSIQAKRMLLEPVALLEKLHERVLNDLLPHPDLRVKPGNDGSNTKREV